MKEMFTERLNYAINLRDIKPAELANKTGISKSRISQYQSGLYKPKSDGIFALAEALLVNPQWLSGEDAPMEMVIPIGEQESLRHYLKELGYTIEFVDCEEINGIIVEVKQQTITDDKKAILPQNKKRLPKITYKDDGVILTAEEYKELQYNIKNLANYELNKIFTTKHENAPPK